MKQAALSFLLLLSITASALQTNAMEPLIDAGSITHWQNSWSPRPIDLSTSNKGEVATLTFYARFTEAVPETGHLEITYPASFSSSGTSGKWDVELPSSGIDEDEEVTFEVTAALPDVIGAVGPFGIIARNYSNGQIVCMTNSFGSIYVKRDVQTGTLGITNSDNSVGLGLTTALDFSFRLTTDVWSNDVFAINLPSGWSQEDALTCASVVPQNSVNYFQSAAGNNNLNCAYSDGVIYIYGTAQEIDVNLISDDQLDVLFNVTGIKAPEFVSSATDNTWSLTQWAARSSQKLTTWSGTGISVTAGTFTIGVWEPHSDFSINNIVQGTTLYMDLRLTAAHAVSSEGYIDLVFTSVNLTSPVWKFQADQQTVSNTVPGNSSYCYIHYQQNVSTNLSCDFVNQSQVRITVTQNQLTQNIPFELSLLTNFNGSTSPTLKVTSYTSNGIVIDTSVVRTLNYAQQTSVSVASTYRLLFDDSLDQLNSPTRINSTGSQGNYYIIAHFQLNSSVYTTTDAKISLPALPGAEVQDYQIRLNETSGQFLVNYDAGTDLVLGRDYSTIGFDSSNSSATVTEDSISASINMTSSNSAWLSFFNAGAGNAISSMNLPRVESNLWTRYETYLLLTEADKITTVATQQIGFIASAWGTATVSLECRFVKQFNLGTRFNTSSGTYSVDFAFGTGFNNDLGSGLMVDDDYPMNVIGDQTNLTLKYSQSRRLTLSGMTSWDTTSGNTQFFTAFQNAVSNNQVVINMQYVFDPNPSITHIVQRSTVTITDDINLGTPNDINTTPTSLIINTDTQFASVDQQFANNGTDNYSLQFPQGFDVSGATFSLSNATTGQSATQPTNVYLLGAGNRQFNYPAVIGYQGTCSDTSCELSVSGVKTPWTSRSNMSFFFGVNNSCVHDSGNNIASGSIAYSRIPTTIKSRGSDNYHYTLTFALTPDHSIPLGGHLQFTLGTDWHQCSGATTCKLSGGGLSQDCNLTAGTTLEDAYTTGDITVTIDKIMPPSNIAIANEVKVVVSSANSSYSTFTIDSTTTSASTDITTIATVGKSTVQELYSFPNYPQASSVDFYMRFSVNKVLPEGSVLRILPPDSVEFLTGPMANDKVFFSKLYSHVQITISYIQITLAVDIGSGDELELYVEDAFNNPTESTVGNFVVQATISCSGVSVTIVDDSSFDVADSGRLVLSTSTISNLTSTQVSPSETVAGRTNNIAISFSTAAQVLATDQIWVKFPRDFDQMVVSENWSSNYKQKRYVWNEPQMYYATCRSADLGTNVECTTQHRWVRVFNQDPLDIGQQITFNVFNVQNPAAVLSTGVFKFYHASADGIFKAANESVAGFQIDAIPNSDLTIQTVMASNNDAFSSADYTFQFFLDGQDLRSSTTLNIQLPRQYTTDLNRGTFQGVTIGCSLVYFDISDDLNDINNPDNAGVQVTQLDNCSISNNVISANFASTTAVSFGLNRKLQLTVQGVRNPEWGFTRSNEVTPSKYYDAWDSNAFTVYEQWTNQIQMSLRDNIENQILCSSYQNINGSWLGFNKKSRGFTANNFDPVNKNNYVKVYSGTQSKDLTVMARNGIQNGLGADKIKLTPSLNPLHISNGSLSFSSVYNDFTLYDTDYELKFRLAASTGSDQGIYYINWAKEETRLDGAEQDAFNPPAKTMVEINNATKQVAISVSPNSSLRVIKGKRSIPIRVFTENAPFESLIVRLTLSDQSLISKVKFSQPTLSFVPDRNQRYFTIEVSDTFDFEVDSASLAVVFSLEGTNAASYKSISDLSFTIENTTEVTEVESPTLTVGDVTISSASLNISTVQRGIVYRQCSPSGGTVMSDENLKLSVADFFKLNQVENSTDMMARGEVQVKPSDDDTSTYTNDWSTFQYKLYKNHLRRFIQIGAVSSMGGTNSYQFPVMNLYGQTNYQCWAYLENEYGQFSPAATATFATLDLPLAAQFSISFNGDVDAIHLSSLQEFVAVTMYTQPTRLINGTTTKQSNTDGQVTSTVFRWEIPAYRHTSASQPSQIVVLTNDQQNAIRNFISNKGITLTPSFNQGAISAYERPTWVSAPSLSEVAQTTTATFTATCSTVGFVCVVCSFPNSLYFSNHNQILLGLDENNNFAAGANCVKAETERQAVQVQVSGLSQNTIYDCHFQCFDTYPTWAGYVQYTQNTDNPIASVEIETAQEETKDDDSANYLAGALAMALLI